MSATRLHPHHSLPAPVVHAGFSIPQSKSHVLAGVQDAYWSDDEAEDAECPLCLEEMDISDLNFKPCVCGYQICRFCWHHIKENLNKRCPACRRIYTDDAVEFKPIATQDHKRLTQQKKQRDRERKDLEALGRRQLANVRVVQRNVVYIVGIGPRFAKEELIPTLRSNEYFGQYGKISKILIVKRNSPGGGGPVVGLYITYHRREDAARAIAAVDGTASPGGGRDVMRASYGTTKYCMAFLRGVSCSDHGCMNLHEWGDEKDCFTKEDLTTLKHTMKATESRVRTVTAKKGDEDAGLPRAASWAQKGTSITSAVSGLSASGSSSGLATSMISRQPRRAGITRQPRNANPPSSSTNEPKFSQGKSTLERKLATASLSRPSTPATTAESTRTDSDSKSTKQKEAAVPPLPSSSPAPSTATSDLGSIAPEAPTSVPERPDSTGSSEVQQVASPSKPVAVSGVGAPPGLSGPSGLSAPPGIPAPPGLSAPPGLTAPPGLSAPPGIPLPNRPPRPDTASPQTPLLASQTSYQMSTAARALLDDVKARRESTLPAPPAFSPFPDFDRTLQTLSGEDGGGFSFNLDPKLADEASTNEQLPEFDLTSSAPFHGSFIDAFPALRTGSPYMQSPSLGYMQASNQPIFDPSSLRTPPSHQHTPRGVGYLGAFNPFSEGAAESLGSSASKSPPQKVPQSPGDEERKVSRFGFARGRQSSTAASSPLHSVSPLSYAGEHASFFHASEDVTSNSLPNWSHNVHDAHISVSHSGSPLHQHAQAQPMFLPPQSRLQSLNGDLSEAQLRNFILSSQERANALAAESQQQQFMPPRYEDPAIMSASFSSPLNEQQIFASMAYGPPPGLSGPQRPTPPPGLMQAHPNGMVDGRGNAAQVSTTSSPPAPLLSAEDFPALSASPSDLPVATSPLEASTLGEPSTDSVGKSQEKAERKAAKKAALAEKALERQRVAQEKAEAKTLEKAKVARQRAAEKENAEKEAALAAAQATADAKELVPVLQEPIVAPQSQPQSRPSTSSDEPKNERPAEKPVAVRRNTKSSDASPSHTKRNDQLSTPSKSSKPTSAGRQSAPAIEQSLAQVPLLSKKPKKNKPIVKPVRIPKEEDIPEVGSLPSVADTPIGQAATAASSSTNSRSHSLDRRSKPTSVQTLLEQIDAMNPVMELSENPFFDIQKLVSPAKMPLEYGPLVHALSALSVGGGSFANNMPSGSIDNAVSSFQQLLETLTQTISDLLRLLPRTTWDDSSSFDGVLRDMLKGDDFLDDGGEDGPGKEDEVAALTLALERRARWMEVQLSKLEELHRDINTAAVRAVLSFNDNGWDRNAFLPRNGNTLARFNGIGTVEQNGILRAMTADELEKKLATAKEAAGFAETEIREAMEKYQSLRN